MIEHPTGTVTLLFTDIEGSTRLLQQLGSEAYARLLGEHHRAMRNAIAACRGIEIKTEGDAFFVVFARASDAITAVVQAQRALGAQEWPGKSAVAVRMGIHTGDVAMVEGEYVGIDIHRAARIAAAAHGGQVLLSEATRLLVAGNMPSGVSTVDLGEHRLKDLDRPEHLYQLVIEGLRAEFPPVRALATRLDLLPAETTTFVGRERELERARELLGGTRLLTLTGPGGTGKTRLSLRLARDVADEFADGAAFVQLAAISDPELVAAHIRQALGFGEDPGATALQTLIERLRDRDVLLVLDNLEQVLDAAGMVAELLAGTERLKVIVTSRSVLHLTGEQEYGVPPLSVPVASDPPDVARLLQYEAVALFVQRARAVRPDFQLDQANARAVVDICVRLDGLPLAIELAASRVKLMPPPALRDRLRDSLDLLQSSTADRTDRQRTLRGAIDWSYRLLAAPEQALFRRLGIFVGGWRLEDAEVIVRGAGEVGLDVLDGLASLLDHSLVKQVEAAGAARFGMLETIREFAHEQLESTAEGDATAAAHAACYEQLVAQVAPGITSSTESADRLDEDQANIRAAVAYLAEHDIGRALEMAGALWRFWHLRGHLREGRATLAELLRRPAPAPPAARARALVGLAGLAYWQLDYQTAGTAYSEALTFARAVGDRALEVETRYSLAYVRAIEHDWDAALSDYDAARELFAELGNELGLASSSMGAGMVATLRGRHDEALPLLDQALASFERLGDGFGIRNTLSVKERALMQLGRLDESRAINAEFLQRSLKDQDPTALSAAVLDAASLEALAGHWERAARLIGAGKRIVEDSGGEAPPELINRIEPLPLVVEHLDPALVAPLVDEGRRMQPDEAVAYALAD